MCAHCLAGEVDAAEGFSTKEDATQCRECGKWHSAAARWLPAEPESPELLSLLTKKIKGLNAKDVKLVDAKFVWTEPNSKRVKVKVTIEKDAGTVVVKQNIEVEFVVTRVMCPTCTLDTVDQVWRAVVQVRQNVQHRRTLFFLEQQILKRALADKAMNVDESPSGIDVFFAKHDHAVKFADAIAAIVPMGKRKESKQLTGVDLQNNDFRFRFTLQIDIVPICRHDLIVLPPQLRSQLFGGRCGVILVYGIASMLRLVDVVAGKQAELSGAKFFQYPFRAAATAREMIEFVVLDVVDNTTLEVARAKDFGENDTRFVVSDHLLAAHVEAGDALMGYDLTPIAERFTEDWCKGEELPECVMVARKRETSKHKGRARLRALGGGEARLWGATDADVEDEATEAAVDGQ